MEILNAAISSDCVHNHISLMFSIAGTSNPKWSWFKHAKTAKSVIRSIGSSVSWHFSHVGINDIRSEELSTGVRGAKGRQWHRCTSDLRSKWPVDRWFVHPMIYGASTVETIQGGALSHDTLCKQPHNITNYGKIIYKWPCSIACCMFARGYYMIHRLSTCFNHPKGQDFTSIHSKVFVNTMGCVWNHVLVPRAKEHQFFGEIIWKKWMTLLQCEVRPFWGWFYVIYPLVILT